jgi:predicted enzyme related to lactoylglutathione lyase
MLKDAVPPIEFEHAEPILRVRDMARSVRYYTEVLGFTNAAWGSDEFTRVCRGDAGIYLAAGDPGSSGALVWIGVSDVPALFEEYTARGATIPQPPLNFSWACEMEVLDPDGHILRFGSEPLATAAQAG